MFIYMETSQEHNTLEKFGSIGYVKVMETRRQTKVGSQFEIDNL